MLTVTEFFAVPIALLHEESIRRQMNADLELAALGAYRVPMSGELPRMHVNRRDLSQIRGRE